MMPTFGNHVCVKCHKVLKIKENGITVAEKLENGDLYKVWSADLYRCLICDYELIAGFGYEPHYVGFSPEAAAEIAKAKELGSYYEFT
jgi:hypothetical protein